MMELTTYTELEIAHRLLTSYAQKCRHLHGHRYEVEITVASPSGLNKDGMIVDFKKLKEVVKEVLDDKWDHGACFNKADRISEFMLKDAERERLHLIDANPTLEWMVGKWVEDLNAAFRVKKIDLVVTKLKASETAKNTVTWTLDEKIRVLAGKPPIEIAGLPSQRAEDTKKRLDAALRPAPKNDCASPGATVKVDTTTPMEETEGALDGVEEEHFVPEADTALYLVQFRTEKLPYSTTVRTARKGDALVDRCYEAAQAFVGGAMKLAPANTPVGDVVLLGITKLPG